MIGGMLERQDAAQATRTVEIDFLYLDLDTCDRCIGTDRSLEAAIAEVAGMLEGANVKVNVRKTQVESEEQAREFRFYSSPTIRVNGCDIALEFRESRCNSCEDACGCDGEVKCRVWVWRGEEYTEAPRAMIVDAVLRAVYGGAGGLKPAREPYAGVPEDLRRFFAARATREERHTDGASAAPISPCCATTEQGACCEPSEKADCCGEAAANGCGCR